MLFSSASFPVTVAVATSITMSRSLVPSLSRIPFHLIMRYKTTTQHADDNIIRIPFVMFCQ